MACAMTTGHVTAMLAGLTPQGRVSAAQNAPVASAPPILENVKVSTCPLLWRSRFPEPKSCQLVRLDARLAALRNVRPAIKDSRCLQVIPCSASLSPIKCRVRTNSERVQMASTEAMRSVRPAAVSHHVTKSLATPLKLTMIQQSRLSDLLWPPL